MSAVENEERRLARGSAVDEAYDTLNEYHMNRRRVVFIANDQKRTGGYGIVRKAHLHAPSYLPTWLASRQYGQPQVVAVKEIRLSGMHDASDLKRSFTKEVLVWSRLKGHPGIAKFLGFCADFDHSEAWLISPWEPYGNVSGFVRRRQLEVPEKLSLAYDTIDALVFLHQLDPPVCHGDIKSANVLVNHECRAVLCDFGLARLYEDSGFERLETTAGFKGSIRWCSPELLDGHPRTASSDVYAWAWLVWEIMTGELPYEGAGAEYIIIRKIFESPLPQVDGESRLSDCLQLWELMTRCWTVDPLHRPTSAMCKTTVEYLPYCPPTPESADPHARSAALLENLGDLESWKCNYKAGYAYLDQALQQYEKEGNDKGIASVLRKQASAALRGSKHVKARNAASTALEKYRKLKDDVGVAKSLYLIGCSFLLETKKVDALPNFEASLEIFRANGKSVDVARSLERLGEIYRQEGRYEKAQSALEEAVDIVSRCGDRLGEASTLISLGHTRWNSDHIEEAIATFQEARSIAVKIGSEQTLATCLCRLGSIKIQQGIHAEAEELLRESVRVARNIDGGWRLGQALWQLGRCLRAQERHEEAISALEESYSVNQSLGSDFDAEVGYAASLVGESKSTLGRREEALVWYDRAIAEWRKGGDEVEISRCLAWKGCNLEDMDRRDEAALHFEASLVIDLGLQDEAGVGWNRAKLFGIPKTVIKWEVGKQSRLALAKRQSLRSTALLCDVKRLQRRVAQLTTPNLKSQVKIVNGIGL